MKNEVYFSKEDWPSLLCSRIEILKARKYTYFYYLARNYGKLESEPVAPALILWGGSDKGKLRK